MRASTKRGLAWAMMLSGGILVGVGVMFAAYGSNGLQHLPAGPGCCGPEYLAHSSREDDLLVFEIVGFSATLLGIADAGVGIFFVVSARDGADPRGHAPAAPHVYSPSDPDRR